jgi:GTP-binding protein
MITIKSAEFEISAGAKKQFVATDLPEIVFTGRSNVGKSSLLNLLCNRKQLAKVSSTPGKTQTINFFRINDRFRFVDLPGYGFAKVSHEAQQSWARLIDAYFLNERPIALVISLLDARHRVQENDRKVLAYLVSRGLPVQPAMTKADKLTQKELSQQKISTAADLRLLGVQRPPLFISSHTGRGQKELFAVIGEALAEINDAG